ncbi:hypothetical protein ACFE04_022502 [Oxalis oulophora]
MPSTDNQLPFSPLRSFGRSLFRREHAHAIEPAKVQESDLERFQILVTNKFRILATIDLDDLLSVAWMQNLLDVFVECLEEFRLLLLKNKTLVSKPPVDRFVIEFYERTVKALDICNATRDGIERIRTWKKHLEIVLSALSSHQRAIGEAQFRRARKALMDMELAMLDEKETGSAFSRRNKSFGRHNSSKDNHRRLPGHARSLSWSVSHSWSAAKQLQSIASNLVAPRGSDIIATNGLAVPIFTMSSVLMFVLWALVAAIPCQDRGLNIHISVPRQYAWATSILSLHERILEESRKRDRRNSNGLLKEIYLMERCSRQLTDLADLAHFPLSEEQRVEVVQAVVDLTLVCDVFKSRLDPLERQVREVFRKIMYCQTEGQGFVGSTSNG